MRPWKNRKCFAIDCEMVGVGIDGKDSVIARVSVVDFDGNVVLDQYVKPTERVVDLRTWVSGIRPRDLANGRHHTHRLNMRNAHSSGKPWTEVQKMLGQIITHDSILVGHALLNDFRVKLIDCIHEFDAG